MSGTVSTENPTEYTIETEKITLNNPTKFGYTFLGWTGSNGSTPQINVNIERGSTENKIYTTNWLKADNSDENTDDKINTINNENIVDDENTVASDNDNTKKSFSGDTTSKNNENSSSNTTVENVSTTEKKSILPKTGSANIILVTSIILLIIGISSYALYKKYNIYN